MVPLVPHGALSDSPGEHTPSLVLELQSFLQSIQAGRPAEVDGEAGLRALQLALALVWSATEGRVLDRDQLRELWADRS